MKSIIILMVSLFLVLSAQAFEVGQDLPDVTFEDQFETAFKIQPETKLIVFVYEKDISKMITEYLVQAQIDPAKLSTVVVSDISGMPSLITKMFAMPKMKKYHFKMALDKSGELTKSWPKQAGKATIVQIDKLKVVNVDYIATYEQIQKIFKGN